MVGQAYLTGRAPNAHNQPKPHLNPGLQVVCIMKGPLASLDGICLAALLVHSAVDRAEVSVTNFLVLHLVLAAGHGCERMCAEVRGCGVGGEERHLAGFAPLFSQGNGTHLRRVTTGPSLDGPSCRFLLLRPVGGRHLGPAVALLQLLGSP
jgi:hypothetical protein